jgi:hypothetical protein
VSYAQCPICALRFRYQSELEAHAHDDHCLSAQVTLPKHAEPRERSDEVTSKLLRLP